MSNEQELKINTLEVMMKENSKEHDEIKKSIASFSDKLDISLEKMEQKFAPMWVKTVLVWGGGIIGSFLILYALNVVFNH